MWSQTIVLLKMKMQKIQYVTSRTLQLQTYLKGLLQKLNQYQTSPCHTRTLERHLTNHSPIGHCSNQPVKLVATYISIF